MHAARPSLTSLLPLLLTWAATAAAPMFADVVSTSTEPSSVTRRSGVRHVRVAVTLTSGGRTWWKRPLPSQTVDGMLVSWGITPLGRGGEVLPLTASPRCPHDPFCRAWSHSSTRCRDLFMPEHEDWRAAYACYAANRTLLFGEAIEIFESELVRDVQQVEIRFYYRTNRYERRQWPAASSSTRGSAAVVKLRFRELPDIDLDVGVELIASPGGDVKDLRIPVCRIQTEEQSALLHGLQSNDVRYCSIEPEMVQQ